MKKNSNVVTLSEIVSLCKRRGFVFQNSEIYGGIQGFYDYGPLGVEMKNNLKKLWWNWMTKEHSQIVGIDGAIVTNPKVWEASGHLKNFTDPVSECKKCHHRFRQEDLAEKKCPECEGELGSPRQFNILMPLELGVIESDRIKAYLRGEACQTIYLDYKNVLNSTRLKVPFGICQIGKAFRNEVTPGNFLFRVREFEQWDLQWFTHPSEMEKWFEYWKEERMKWYKSIFSNPNNLSFFEHKKLAHYAKKAFDIIYKPSPTEVKEIEGIHWRGDWDLSRHAKYSGVDLSYLDPVSGEKFVPWIVETSGGVDRTFLFLLIDSYYKEKDRIVLRLNPKVSPFQAAVFPLLSNKEELNARAQRIFDRLKKKFSVAWDGRGNIGKRYYSQDEIGTPWCITIDFETIKNDTVTVRDRDSTKQERIPEDKLEDYFNSDIQEL